MFVARFESPTNELHINTTTKKDLCLYQKYAPASLEELCTSSINMQQIRSALEKHRYFCICSMSGNGTTVSTRLMCEHLNIKVFDVTCGSGYSQIYRNLNCKSANVIQALNNRQQKNIFFIKDINCLNKNEKSQVLKLIQDSEHLSCIIFVAEKTISPTWPSLHISEITLYEKQVHIAWIAAEESISITIPEINTLAEFADLRCAINSMDSNRKNTISAFQQRDYSKVEDFNKILYTHETLSTKPYKQHPLELCVQLFELILDVDATNTRSTREWFCDIAANYVDTYFDYTKKQTFVARSAQICNRISQLKAACKTINIHPYEMSLYSILLQTHIMNNQIYYTSNIIDYAQKQKAVYTISKMNLTAAKCKLLKRKLDI